jgi:hypothetical protein
MTLAQLNILKAQVKECEDCVAKMTQLTRLIANVNQVSRSSLEDYLNYMLETDNFEKVRRIITDDLHEQLDKARMSFTEK